MYFISGFPENPYFNSTKTNYLILQDDNVIALSDYNASR